MSTSLVIDASTPLTQVGLLKDSSWIAFAKAQTQALQDIFPLTDQMFISSGLNLSSIDSFTYCHGPGSMLGIRIACMAIRTWNTQQPVYAYNSLDIATHMVPQHAFVYTPSRKDQYFLKSTKTSMTEVDQDYINNLPIKHLLQDVYNLEPFPALLQGHKPVDDIDAKLFRKTEYKKWSGDRHRKD